MTLPGIDVEGGHHALQMDGEIMHYTGRGGQEEQDTSVSMY